MRTKRDELLFMVANHVRDWLSLMEQQRRNAGQYGNAEDYRCARLELVELIREAREESHGKER